MTPSATDFLVIPGRPPGTLYEHNLPIESFVVDLEAVFPPLPSLPCRVGVYSRPAPGSLWCGRYFVVATVTDFRETVNKSRLFVADYVLWLSLTKLPAAAFRHLDANCSDPVAYYRAADWCDEHGHHRVAARYRAAGDFLSGSAGG